MKKEFKILKYRLRRTFFKTKRQVPIFIFGYHKCGTKLLGKIFLQLSLKYGWKFKSIAGFADDFNGADVVFLLHSQVDVTKLPKEYIGIHMVRDPRDIVVSGYLYHKRTNEEWCINKNFQTTDKIKYPQVPNSQMYRDKQWKISYLKSLNNKSYQEKINSLDQEEGILFELEHYGKWTMEDMLKWDNNLMNCIEIKFEDLMGNFDVEMNKIFKHCKFNESQINVATKIANMEDINKMSPNEIKKRTHISSKKTSKWEQFFTEKITNTFMKDYKSVLIKYNYK